MVTKSKLHNALALLIAGFGVLPLAFFVSVEMGIAQAASSSEEDQTIESSPLDRFVDNTAFGVNEKFSFDINYGFINAGTATMEVARLIEFNDRPCYQIVTQAYSNSFFSSVFKVEDRVESIIDAEGIFSWRFEKNLKEGGYRADRTYEFDQVNQQVIYDKDTIELPEYVQDALSAMYYIRTQKLVVGKSLFVNSFTDGKLYPLEVKVVKKETITVDAGTFDCIVVEPLTKSVGVFKHEGKLTVWLTDDLLKMPVLMKSKVLVGSISAELTDYQLGDIESF